MTTPVWDFVRQYAARGGMRFHMPGHKGKAILGCEALDLTEVSGADALYTAHGILAEGEANTAALFGSQRTCWSTEGSSHCVRAMVYLALRRRRPGTPPLLLAARNAHRSFFQGCALCGGEIRWLPLSGPRRSLCAWLVTPEALERELRALPAPPAGVWITSPDYLGNQADLAGLAEVCRRFDTPLLVDNAHGAYLRFLRPSAHPLDKGAAMCCDSAHKTLPVLTGGAWLHVGKNAPPDYAGEAKQALALFGSSSPSYLILASLDRCNAYLAENYSERLEATAVALVETRAALERLGWQVEPSDPLRLTLRGNGYAIAGALRQQGGEPEYVDRDFAVLMLTPENGIPEIQKIPALLGPCATPPGDPPQLPVGCGETVYSPRETLFHPWETIPTPRALGRICAGGPLSCPPAIPIAVPGERIGPEAVELCGYYGIEKIDVFKESCY